MNLEQVRIHALAGVLPPRRDLPPRPRRAAELAITTGAPLVPALDAAAAAARDDRRRARTVEVATAQARVVLVCLAGLPPFAIAGIGRLLDQDLWRFYLTPPGSYVGFVGAALLAAGSLLARHLVRRAVAARPATGAGLGSAVAAGVIVALLTRPIVGLCVAGVTVLWSRRDRSDDEAPSACDEVADLVATALRAGLTSAAALCAVADVLPEHREALRRGGLAHDLGIEVPLPPGVAQVDEVLRTASAHGAPAASALRRLGEELRERELARATAAAERLPALLAFPTALFLLPASVLLVGAPLLAVGLAEAGGGIR